jgi:hypothetical protein
VTNLIQVEIGGRNKKVPAHHRQPKKSARSDKKEIINWESALIAAHAL